MGRELDQGHQDKWSTRSTQPRSPLSKQFGGTNPPNRSRVLSLIEGHKSFKGESRVCIHYFINHYPNSCIDYGEIIIDGLKRYKYVFILPPYLQKYKFNTLGNTHGWSATTVFCALVDLSMIIGNTNRSAVYGEGAVNNRGTPMCEGENCWIVPQWLWKGKDLIYKWGSSVIWLVSFWGRKYPLRSCNHHY